MPPTLQSPELWGWEGQNPPVSHWKLWQMGSLWFPPLVTHLEHRNISELFGCGYLGTGILPLRTVL